MSHDIMTTHSFEVPIYLVPSTQFLETMRRFSHLEPNFSADVRFWKDKLIFHFSSTDGKELVCSTRLFPHDFSNSNRAKMERKISTFASKFNCSMVFKDSCDLTIELVEPSDDKSLYDNKVYYIIKVTIVITSLPVEMALNNLFAVVDLSYKNSGDNSR